jgi:uncharacterized protein (TIGR02391 family)
MRRTVPPVGNFIARLEELMAALRMERDILMRALAKDAVEALKLQPRIAAACTRLFVDGHFRQAVLDASLALTEYVKERSGCRERDGADLMRYVFSRNGSVLAFNLLADETDRSEQEGMMHLFEGVMLALRNPRAHTLSDDSPEQALEYIALLSLLAKQVERARRA